VLARQCPAVLKVTATVGVRLVILLLELCYLGYQVKKCIFLLLLILMVRTAYTSNPKTRCTAGGTRVLLNSFKKMNVQLAAQVMSHSVAVEISFYMNCGNVISTDAAATVNFILHMDKLLNSLQFGSII